MNKRMQLLLVLVTGLTLMACSNDDAQPVEDEALADGATASTVEPAAETDQAADAVTEQPVAALLDDPEALREAMRDPEQRATLMQAMRERRQARRDENGEVDRDAMRERMRQRREEMMANRDPEQRGQRMRERMGAPSEWWNDEAMVQSLALDDAQIQALESEREALEERRSEARQRLSESQREMMIALETVDRERLTALIEQRGAANQALQQAELDWWKTLLEQLNDEQLATLARENPQLLIGRRR